MVSLAAARVKSNSSLVVVDFHYALGEDQLYFLTDVGIGYAVIVLVRGMTDMTILLYCGDFIVSQFVFLQRQWL